MRSRNDSDFIAKYPAIAKALAAMPNETVIDGEIVSAQGHELAQLRYGRTRTLLRFAKDLVGDPFTRMLIVAAALLWRR